MIQPNGHRDDWWGTVGSIVLCSDQRVVVTSIRAGWITKPVGVRYTLRTLRRTDPKDQRQELIGSAWGTPPDFAEPYAQLVHRPIAGWMSVGLGGLPVTTPCPAGASGKEVTELLVSMHVDRHGAAFRRVVITYETEGHTYRRLVDGWLYIACGDRIRIPRECPAGQHAPGVASLPS